MHAAASYTDGQLLCCRQHLWFLTEDEDLMKYLPDSAGDLGSGTKTKNHYNTGAQLQITS